MSLATLNELLIKAQKEKYGIPCLLGGNIEMIMGEIKAAEKERAPLIISFNENITPMIPIEFGISVIVNAAKKAKVPVAVILDHGRKFDSIMKAMNSGATAVMYDGSSLSYEENVKNTKELVKAAHSMGVSLEAELGNPGGSHYETGGTSGDTGFFTVPEQVVDFVKETNIDALAISFGNVHGIYKGEPMLDLDRVRKIRSLTDVPLVMHGGSGLNRGDYKKIIECGVCKINYVSEMTSGAVMELKKMLNENQNEMKYNNIISAGIDYFYGKTKELFDIFGSAGKSELNG